MADRRGNARRGREPGVSRPGRLQRRDVEKLWEMDLGDTNVTSISYTLDGKQYVTLFAREYPENRLFALVLDGKNPVPANNAWGPGR